LRAYLSNINIIHTNDSICEIAAEIRKNNKVKLPDAIIAATSLFLSIPLVTFDKGFRSINKLRIITPLV
jgi:predicted nucleic acid-binding protein